MNRSAGTHHCQFRWERGALLEGLVVLHKRCRLMERINVIMEKISVEVRVVVFITTCTTPARWRTSGDTNCSKEHQACVEQFKQLWLSLPPIDCLVGCNSVTVLHASIGAAEGAQQCLETKIILPTMHPLCSFSSSAIHLIFIGDNS